MAKNIDIAGRLHSMATGNVVAGSDEILDDALGKKQSVINQELYQGAGRPQLNTEDLDYNSDNQLQFANRLYDSESPDGMGYKILRQGDSLYNQMTDSNTVYEVRYDFSIGENSNESITFSSSNISSCVSPLWEGEYEKLQLYQNTGVGNRLSIIGEDGVATGLNITQEVIDEQQAVVNNTPHYLFYTTVHGKAGRALHIDGKKFVFLNDERTAIDRSKGNVFCGDENDIVYIGTVYPGTYTFKESGAVIIPENCVLKFEGGSIDNGVLYGNHTNIVNESNAEVFGENITIAGLWDIDEINDTWFKYEYEEGVAKNEVIENMLHLTHDDYYSVINISSGRNYLVEQKDIPIEHTGGIRQNIVRFVYGIFSKYSYWEREPLIYDIMLFELPSNSKIVHNSIITMLPCAQGVYTMFEFSNKKNITIEGNGIIYGDVHDNTNRHDYNSLPCWTTASGQVYYGEWGHIFRICGSENIKVSDIKLSGAFGDTIYIEGTCYDTDNVTLLEPGFAHVTDGAVIENVTIDWTRRNGISLGARNVLVDGCSILNTGSAQIYGTAPKAAIDFEADLLFSAYGHSSYPEAGNRNCVVRNCMFRNSHYSFVIANNYNSDYNGYSASIYDCEIGSIYFTPQVKNVILSGCLIRRILYARDANDTGTIELSDVKAIGCTIDYIPPILIKGIKENCIDVKSSVVKYSQCEKLEVHSAQNDYNSRLTSNTENEELPLVGNILHIQTDASIFSIDIKGYIVFFLGAVSDSTLRVANVNGIFSRNYNIISDISVVPNIAVAPNTRSYWSVTPYFQRSEGKSNIYLVFRDLFNEASLNLSAWVRHEFDISIEKYYNFTTDTTTNYSSYTPSKTTACIISSLPWDSETASAYKLINYKNADDILNADSSTLGMQYNGITLTDNVLLGVHNKRKYKIPYSDGLWAGVTADRPTLYNPDTNPDGNILYNGFKYMDSELVRPIYWYGGKWIDGNWRTPGKIRGNYNLRPTGLNDTLDRGFQFYDTDFKKHIYWSGSNWVDEKGFTATWRNGTSGLRDALISGVTTGLSTLQRALYIQLSSTDVGFDFYDTDLQKVFYLVNENDTLKWLDAEGKEPVITETVDTFTADSMAINYEDRIWAETTNWAGTLIDVTNHRGDLCTFTGGRAYTYVTSSPIDGHAVDYASGYGAEGYGYATSSIVPADAVYLWVQVNDENGEDTRKPYKIVFYKEETSVNTSGTKAQRPSGDKISVGFQYMQVDITYGTFPIWAAEIAVSSPYTVTWVKADGTDPDNP